MQKEKYWSVAEQIVRVSGSEEMVDNFSNQFLWCEINYIPDSIDIDIKIVDSLSECKFEPKLYSLSKSIQFNENEFYKKTDKYCYVVKNLFVKGTTTEIFIVDSYKFGIIENINRINRGKEKAYWKCNSYMNYGFVWMFFALALQKKEKAFVHSGIVSINEKATVFCGTGGCGKTSTLFKLLEREGAKYIAEDFGIIDKKANAFYSPKTVTIYETDIKHGQKDFVNLRKNMSKRENLIWNIDKAMGRNPRKKTSAVNVLGENRLSKGDKIKTFVFLAREDREDTICESIDIDEIAYRITEATYRELKEIYEILSNIHAIGGKKTSYPTIEELKIVHSNIIRNALANSDFCLCRVNKNGTPNDIINAVSKYI